MPMGRLWGTAQGFRASPWDFWALSSPDNSRLPHLQEEGLCLPTEPAGVQGPCRGEQDAVGRHLCVGHSLLVGHQPDHHVREAHLGLPGRRASGLCNQLQGLLPGQGVRAHLREHSVEAV